jgi:hypothetical protein
MEGVASVLTLREGIDEHAVSDAVDRGGGADSESEGEDRGEREAWRAAQLA